MAHHTDSSGTYVDTAFLNSVGKVPGVSLQHMGFGEFYAETPKGRVDFDRMRGKDFPGQSGRSHKLYGKGVDWLVKQMERGNHSEKMAGGNESGLRNATIRLAHSLPQGSDERKALLTALVDTEEKVSLASLAEDAPKSLIASAKVRTASKLPKGSQHRRKLLAELKEARRGQKWWDKQVVGERVRIRWSTGGRGGSLVIQELPGKPFKRHLRQARFPINNMHFGYDTPSAFLMENLTRSAMFGRAMNYDRAVMAFSAAIDAAIAEAGDQLADWQTKQLQNMPHEDTVYYLEVEPSDYSPIRASGKDFGIISEWREFRMHDERDDDEYMRQMEGMQAFYKEKSKGGARKMYKLVTGLVKAGKLSRMTFAEFKRMLDKNKIAYRYVPTVWR